MSDIENENDGEETDHGDDLEEDEADDEETASLRPLFPDGDPSKEGEWKELYPEAEPVAGGPGPENPQTPDQPENPGGPGPEHPQAPDVAPPPEGSEPENDDTDSGSET